MSGNEQKNTRCGQQFENFSGELGPQEEKNLHIFFGELVLNFKLLAVQK